ncbi:hypothetical protein CGRA01v4_11679 [Colletotrichum graminicola]|nr:hypothetical protein CGRA01v4_11679 [Colletotrichum graminicola]
MTRLCPFFSLVVGMDCVGNVVDRSVGHICTRLRGLRRSRCSIHNQATEVRREPHVTSAGIMLIR